MKTLLIAEADAAGLRPASLHALSAALSFDMPVSVFVSGLGIGAAIAAAQALPRVEQVLACEGDAVAHGLPEVLAPMLADLVKARGFTQVVVAATSFGKNLLPRLGALLDVQPISEIMAIEGRQRFVRPIYAGNALATVESLDPIILCSVRTTAFDAAVASGGNASLENLPAPSASVFSHFVGQELSQSARPELTAARIVVSGGRGMGSGENFKILEALADKLGAAVGASRAAVDAGFVPNEYQVGQTGKVVAPDLYIAVGISGAIQHLAGMKDSKVIVAINKDGDAPIFQVADYGLVGDLFALVPELTGKI